MEEIVGFRWIYRRQGAILFTEKGERFVKATEAIEQQLKASIDDLKTTSQTAVD
ncbi:MAG: hypothetical protein FWF41_07795 [Betaproteobacteria bacterium]|nr:hypothetical protein [Betaproteobacteria bacterium]